MFLVAAAAGSVAADDQQPLFPFVVSYDSPQNATNVSDWLPRPAGKQGFVHAENGRLVTGTAGSDKTPIRFWATNLCFEACFPSREQAQRLASRLARLGINCVRMHHMDSRAIWGDSPDHLTIDPKKLDRLDYLVYQLKLHGVYTDLNLHVSRWFDRAEGFVARQQRPNYDKGLDNFEPRMIQLQKKYARDLLAHVNPYTKTPYTSEPALAFVEINNENAIFAEWYSGQLDDLPEPYATTFRKLWNAWLQKKHGDTATLRRAWNVGQWPLAEEMLVGGDFTQRLPGRWRLETDDQAKAVWSVEAAGPEGRPALRIVVKQMGRVAWRPQLVQSGFLLKKGMPYTLTFYARSAKPHRLGVNCMMAHEPWERLGLDVRVAIQPQWKQHRCTFIADRDDANARITLSNLLPGTYELAGVSLRSGGTIGLTANQRIEDWSVPVLQHGDLGMTEPARRDFIDFLYQSERDYWSGMYRFLKDELGVRSLVSGTQLGYSPVTVQAGLDYIDAHSYWNHPEFPGRPWDRKNWAVRNVALVNSPGGTLSGLASRRVAGMAFTVSEYNHPEPNVYAAEGFPMIAAFGAMQSWDGIFSFAYCHDADFEPRRITSFFDIKSVTSRLVHMPACAAMFVRGDVAPARSTALVPLSAEAERKKLHETLSAWRLTTTDLGLDPQVSLLRGTALALGKTAARTTPAAAPPKKDATRFVSDTGELCWDVSLAGAGVFTVNTPRSKLFTGFVRGRSFDLGNVRLAIGPTRLDWATVSLVSIDAAAFDRPGRILIAATGLVQNQGAELQHLSGNKVTLGDRWGTEPILCEAVPCEILLPVAADRVRLFPLNESGERGEPVPVDGRDGKALLRLDPKHRTLWYEAQVK